MTHLRITLIISLLLTTLSVAGDRGLAEFTAVLGARFSDDLAKLGPREHWIDVSVGNDAAIREYVDGEAEKSNAVECAIKKFYRVPASLEAKLRRTSSQRAKVSGLVFDSDKLGKADLITDLNGDFAYADRLDSVLDHYFSVLNGGGVIYIYIGSDEALAGRTRVIIDSEHQLNIVGWLERIQGLSVEVVKTEGAMNVLRLTKTGGADLFVPELELQSSVAGTPPSRVFAEKKWVWGPVFR